MLGEFDSPGYMVPRPTIEEPVSQEDATESHQGAPKFPSNIAIIGPM